MAWEYLPLPDGLRLPPCPQCRNRGRVVLVVAEPVPTYVCTDCHPAHVFRARWVAATRVTRAPRQAAG